MFRSKGFFAAALAATLAAILLATASGQENEGTRGGKQNAKQGPPAPIPAILKNYQPVTAQRLLKPEDGNWLMIRRTYDGWGYSPLDQITGANVARLRPVWGSATGEGRAHESAPVVNNGVLFITTPNNQVILRCRHWHDTLALSQAASTRSDRSSRGQSRSGPV